MHYDNKFTFESVRCYSSLADNKQISYLCFPQTRGVPETLFTDPSTQFKSTFCLILLRLIDYSADAISRRVRTVRPAAEFRGQDLRTACKEKLLSQQLCVPTKPHGLINLP
ncbi:hypothetical protein ACTXT7_008992 [Hymenolepis weldensis]